MFKKIILSVALMVAFTATANAANMWGEYGADAQNTGQSKFVGPDTADDTVKVPLLSRNRDNFSAPVVDGIGNVYYLNSGYYDDGSYANLLKSFDWEGNLLWEKTLPDNCWDTNGTTGIALANNSNKLFILCAYYRYNTEVFAYDKNTGNQLWHTPLEGYTTRAIGAITVDANDNIYFQSTGDNGHTVLSLDQNGAVRWITELLEGREWDTAGPVLTNDESAVIVYRSVRYYTYDENGSRIRIDGALIESLSTADGSINWSKFTDWGGTGWQTQTSFAVDANDTLWVLSYFKDEPGETCRGYSTGLHAIDITNGNTISTIPIQIDIDCGPHVVVGPSGTIYITYDDAYRSVYNPDTGTRDVLYDIKGGIAAVDPVNGIKWQFELPDSYEANATPAIDAQENIYFTASFGQILYKLDKDGNTVWEYNIDPLAVTKKGYDRYANDQFNYGASVVIGRGGTIYAPSLNNLHIIKNNITEEAVIASIEELVTSGDLNTGNASAIISSIENAIDANTDNAHDNMLDATINKIEALVASGRMDADSAQSMIDTLNLLK